MNKHLKRKQRILVSLKASNILYAISQFSCDEWMNNRQYNRSIRFFTKLNQHLAISKFPDLAEMMGKSVANRMREQQFKLAMNSYQHAGSMGLKRGAEVAAYDAAAIEARTTAMSLANEAPEPKPLTATQAMDEIFKAQLEQRKSAKKEYLEYRERVKAHALTLLFPFLGHGSPLTPKERQWVAQVLISSGSVHPVSMKQSTSAGINPATEFGINPDTTFDWNVSFDIPVHHFTGSRPMLDDVHISMYKTKEGIKVEDDFNLDNLDLDSAAESVEQKQQLEQSQEAPVANNDCGDSCTI